MCSCIRARAATAIWHSWSMDRLQRHWLCCDLLITHPVKCRSTAAVNNWTIAARGIHQLCRTCTRDIRKETKPISYNCSTVLYLRHTLSVDGCEFSINDVSGSALTRFMVTLLNNIHLDLPRGLLLKFCMHVPPIIFDRHKVLCSAQIMKHLNSQFWYQEPLIFRGRSS